jgi:hypothetical protein
MNSSLEHALKETWEKKEKFYEDTKGLTMIEILEKIEGKKFNLKNKSKDKNLLETVEENR